MKTKSPFISRIWTHPLLWILMLMPIALVGHWLALYWPSVDNMMNMSSDFSHDHGSLIVHHTYATSTKTGNSDQGTSRNFHINLETGSVLFSVLRFAPLPKANAFDLGFIEGLVNCLLMAMNVMVVSWCALSGRAIWVRWPMWLGSPLICATVGVLYSAWLHQSKNFEWIAAYHGVVQMTAAVTVFFLLHAYRWRGWRFAS